MQSKQFGACFLLPKARAQRLPSGLKSGSKEEAHLVLWTGSTRAAVHGSSNLWILDQMATMRNDSSFILRTYAARGARREATDSLHSQNGHRRAPVGERLNGRYIG